MKSLLQKLGLGGYPSPYPIPPPQPNRTDRMIEWIWNWCQSSPFDIVNNKLDTLLQRSSGAPVVSVEIVMPRYFSKEGIPVAKPVTLPDNQKVSLPLGFKDAIGSVHAPLTGGHATSSDDTIATVVLADDDASMMVTSVADGKATITYTNDSVSPSITDSTEVTVGVPAPTSVEIDVDHAVFSAR